MNKLAKWTSPAVAVIAACLLAACLLATCGHAAAQSGVQSGVQNAPEPPQQFADLGDLKLENGATIHNCQLGYRTVGTLNADRSNVILYPSWFTGNSHDILATLGPDGYFDPAPYFVILVDALGDGVSCSPSNSTTQHGAAFPVFTIRDMVASEHRLLTEMFGLKHIHAITGGSMGGMQTFQWLATYPDFMDVAIPIVGTPRLTSYDELLWRTEEQAILEDPAYESGHYRVNPTLPTLHLIHSMNQTTPEYRVGHTTRPQFEQFFAETGATTNGAFDANDWRWQLHAMLSQDIASGGSLLELAKRIHTRLLVINASQDHMVNPIPALRFAAITHSQAIVLDGNCGHLAPGCESSTIRPAIEAILKQHP